MEQNKRKRKRLATNSEAPLRADRVLDLLDAERMNSPAADLGKDIFYYCFGIHTTDSGCKTLRPAEIELVWMCKSDALASAAPRMDGLLKHWKNLEIVKAIKVERFENPDNRPGYAGERWLFEFTRPVVG